MKLHPATFYLLILQYSDNLRTATSQECAGVSGDFRLTGLSGTCTYAKLLDAYTRQVFDATGSTCQTGSELSAKEDFDLKLTLAVPGVASAEEKAKTVCKGMYDTADVT